MSFKEYLRTLRRTLWFALIKIPERFIVAPYSPHGNATFFDPGEFPWTALLEVNWKVIRKELEGVLQQRDCLPNFQDIAEEITVTSDNRWKVFFLYGFGHKVEANCAHCPKTTTLIEQVPGMVTAFFSILYPHKHIPEHRGPYKGLLRYHLGLVVPEPETACRIRVGKDTAHWVEGKSLIFDDTHPHEVWNDTEGVRVVLFMDVVRPLLPPASILNEWLIKGMSQSPQVRKARKKQEQWERCMVNT